MNNTDENIQTTHKYSHINFNSILLVILDANFNSLTVALDVKKLYLIDIEYAINLCLFAYYN